MSDVAYVSTSRIVRIRGSHRNAFLPAESQPVIFGVHGAIAAHYGVQDVAEPHATTIDYVIAATAG